jgi:PAS domain S-box-containing protein
LVKSRQAQKVLRASEKKYRTFFDKANDAVFIADVKTGVILDANKGAEKLLGCSRRKIIGMHQSQLHPAGQVKYYTEKFRNHVRNNRTVDFEAEIVKKDGTTVPVCISAAVMEHQGKKVIQGIFGDITGRKRAEARVQGQLRFLQSLVDTLPTPIFYKGKDGKYTGCNKAFEEFVGRPREKIIGKTVYDMGPKRIADKYYEKDQELFQNPGKQVYEWKVKRKTGELREVVFNKATFTDADGKVVGLIGGISDITERKQADDAVRKREAELKAQSHHLKEVNAALKVLLKQREDDKKDVEENVLSNVKQLVTPHLERLKKSRLNTDQGALVGILESNLNNIVSPFVGKLSSKFLALTPTEIRVADLVKEGKTNKDIAELLPISKNTVLYHRYNIRTKLGLRNRKINLRSYLLSLAK